MISGRSVPVIVIPPSSTAAARFSKIPLRLAAINSGVDGWSASPRRVVMYSVERQRTKHDGVEGAEHGRGGTDAQRQRDDRHGREAARSRELARRERNVVSKLAEILGATRLLVSLSPVATTFSVY